MKKQHIIYFLIPIVVILILWGASDSKQNSDYSASREKGTKVVINEAVRTLLYLPLYHAIEQGYFKEQGLDVEVVTGGTATNSFAAMLSGEADFSQADPMYVPISREKGSKTKVVAQVVGRIAVWGLSMSGSDMSADSLQGKSEVSIV